jgi:hypothetical protein
MNSMPDQTRTKNSAEAKIFLRADDVAHSVNYSSIPRASFKDKHIPTNLKNENLRLTPASV